VLKNFPSLPPLENDLLHIVHIALDSSDPSTVKCFQTPELELEDRLLVDGVDDMLVRLTSDQPAITAGQTHKQPSTTTA
jgi:hypothetical protein